MSSSFCTVLEKNAIKSYRLQTLITKFFLGQVVSYRSIFSKTVKKGIDGMLFSFENGSKGTDEESFTIRIPFILSPSKKIQISLEDSILKVDKFEAKIIDEKFFNVIEVYGLPSEKAANQFLPKIVSGLLLTIIDCKIGILFEKQPSRVRLFEKPIIISEKSDMYSLLSKRGWEETDGDYDTDKTIIRPEHKKLVAWTMGRATVTTGIHDSDIINKLNESLALSNPERLIKDEKLQLAIEIYSNSFFESSSNAKFVTLVTVLEALKIDSGVSEIEIETIDELMEQIKTKRDSQDKEDPNSSYAILDKLIGRVGNLKEQSISKSIQTLVIEKLKFDPGVDNPAAYGKEIKDIYNLRCTLLHDGLADSKKIEDGIKFLSDVVPRLLRVIFFQEGELTITH